MPRLKPALCYLFIALFVVPHNAFAAPRTLRETVNDYVRLYRSDTLPEWKKLFHTALSVASPAADGAIRLRNLEEFYSAQEGFLASARVSERLENVRILEGRRIARVAADFILTENGRSRRGKLGLHLVQEHDEWRIVAIVFSYDRL